MPDKNIEDKAAIIMNFISVGINKGETSRNNPWCIRFPIGEQCLQETLMPILQAHRPTLSFDQFIMYD